MAPGEPPPWRLVPRFLLRRAGFGFDLLEPVGDARAADAAAAYRAAVRACETARQELLRRRLPAAVAAARAAEDGTALRALSALRSAAGRRRPPGGKAALLERPFPAELTAAVDGYTLALAERGRAADRLTAALGDERDERPTRLRGCLDTPVLDAVLQLAPSFYDSLVRWADQQHATGGAREGALLRRLYLYLQRLAAKNETTSFFGPLVHGFVVPEDSGVRFGPQAPGGVRRTEAFLAFWAVDALARRIAADPLVRPRIPVERVAAVRVDGEVLGLPTGKRVRLTPALARLAACVDGTACAGDLARAAELPVAETDRLLATLERLGAVRVRPEPASTAPLPFGELLAFADVHAAGTGWPERLRALHDRLERYGRAPDPAARRTELDALERMFTDIAAVPPRRSGGRMYADRMVAYLDCEGDLGPVRLGADLAERITAELAPVLDLGALFGEQLHRAHQRLASEVLEAAGVPSMPYDAFVRAIGASAASGGLAPHLAAARDLHDRLAALVRDRTRDGVAVLAPQELRALGAPDRRPRFASPDILLRGETDGGADHGGPGLVLGEVHPYMFAWGSQGRFSPDPEGLQRDCAADLEPWGGRAAMATVLRRRAHKGLVSAAFPGRFVEVTARSGAAGRSVPVTALHVERDASGRVRLLEGDRELVLYAGENDHPHLAAFAPPPALRLPLVRFGDEAPRVVVGGLVVQRACRWLPARLIAPPGGTPSAAAAYLRVQELRATRGLPRWVYARISSEPKPVCLDLDAPLAVEVLVTLAAAAGEEPVALTEMLPEPGSLWLHRQGRPTTSELRIALTRAGTR
ncbi:lantibiotic dehydratase [Streptomyces sp. NPDC021224]|uniref:lantibiotic dehydratase n=1 Tax=unclassified Streptomyces TaxID=2593676 RepID=UPI003792F0C9